MPVFDYLALMDALKNYKYPRDKVTSLLRDGSITRIKKGMYTQKRTTPSFSSVKEPLANMLYGPSYISLQYALYLYGMLPEYAQQVTSVTMKKTKRYQTPLGDFIYRSVPQAYYVTGILRREEEGSLPYLIASREKALLDMFYFATGLTTPDDAQTFMIEDLRIEEEVLRALDFEELSRIAGSSNSRKLTLCLRAMEMIAR